jgi:hypothetical protein
MRSFLVYGQRKGLSPHLRPLARPQSKKID